MSSAGQVTGIYLAAERGAGKTACATAELVAGHGLQGDAHAGTHPHRHISLFAQEIVHALHPEGFPVTPGALSANLFISGLPLDTLPLGTQLRIGPVLLELSEQRKPCRSITRIDHRLPKRLFGQCGQFARVLVGGKVQVGDTVELLRQP